MISVTTLQAAGVGVDTDTTVLANMIARAVSFLQTQTGRHFGPVDRVTEFYSGSGATTLWLKEPPILEGGEGSIDVTERGDPSELGVDLDELEDFSARVDGREGYLVRWHRMLWRKGYEYEVEYDRGYAVDAGPGDIEQLLIDLIAFKLKMQGTTGMRSETIGGYSYTRFGEGDLDAIDGAWDTIKAWRRGVIA